MKRIATALAAAAAIAANAADADLKEILAATLRSDGTTNTWTAADLQDALGMLNRRYWREMQTDGGRRSWHGGITASGVYTNDMGAVVRRDVYEDGYTHETAFTPRKVTSAISAEERRAARVAGLKERYEAATAALDALGADADEERRARLVIEKCRLKRALQREGVEP